jgi:hypothetical protein
MDQMFSQKSGLECKCLLPARSGNKPSETGSVTNSVEFSQTTREKEKRIVTWNSRRVMDWINGMLLAQENWAFPVELLAYFTDLVACCDIFPPIPTEYRMPSS